MRPRAYGNPLKTKNRGPAFFSMEVESVGKVDAEVLGHPGSEVEIVGNIDPEVLGHSRREVDIVGKSCS